MTTYLNIGISGLRAAQMGLVTTQHNIANVGTAGYSRQTTFQATGFSVNTGDGALGQGVQVQTIKRNYSDFLTAQSNVSQSRLTELETLYNNFSQIDNVLADPMAGLAPSLSEFFSSVQQVAANPSLVAARQAMVSSAQTLAARFQALDGRMDALTEQVNGRITTAVDQINALTSNIAQLNQSIVIAQAAYNQPANDLLDQRDYLVTELNKLMKVSTSSNYDGSVNVFFGSGQQLVVGNQATQITAQQQAGDASKTSLAIVYSTGSVELPDSLVQGGELGALIGFRNGALEKAINGLSQIAASVALTMNAQQMMGQNLYGEMTGEGGFVDQLFVIPEPKVQASSLNTGAGTLSVSLAPLDNASGAFSTQLTSDTYRVTITGTGPVITRLSDNQPVSPVVDTSAGTVYRFDGIQFELTGGPAVGNSYLIKPVASAAREIQVNPSVVADPRLIAAASPVRTAQDLGNQGSMKISVDRLVPGFSVNQIDLEVQSSGGDDVLAGFPGNWVARYSNGNEVSGSGDLPMLDGSALLTGFSVDGVVFKVTGLPQVGDQFSIQRNTGGVQDGRNAAAMASLQTDKTMLGGAANFNSAYAGIVAESGVQTRELKIRMDAQSTLHQQITSARESISGVNLDEEAANLLRYQQAYQASAKAMQIGVDLFERLLSIR